MNPLRVAATLLAITLPLATTPALADDTTDAARSEARRDSRYHDDRLKRGGSSPEFGPSHPLRSPSTSTC